MTQSDCSSHTLKLHRTTIYDRMQDPHMLIIRVGSESDGWFLNSLASSSSSEYLFHQNIAESFPLEWKD